MAELKTQEGRKWGRKEKEEEKKGERKKRKGRFDFLWV